LSTHITWPVLTTSWPCIGCYQFCSFPLLARTVWSAQCFNCSSLHGHHPAIPHHHHRSLPIS
jgi:hypothetical protein